MAPASKTPGLELIAGDDPKTDAVSVGILDAAFEQFCTLGIRRSSMEDVARRAGVGRVTIYRRFENKDKLVEALFRRELRTAMATVTAARAAADDVAERWVVGFVAGMRVVRSHRLLRTLLATEPEVVLPLLTLKAGPGLAAVAAFLEAEVRQSRLELGLPADDSPFVGELLARLTLSLLLTPETKLPIEDEAAAAEFARRFIVPQVVGLSGSTG